MSMMISGDPPENLSDRQLKVYPGRQSLPLTDDGVNAFRKASRDGDHKDRLLGEGLLLTGLKPGTFAHMTSEWLEWDGSRLFVRVPGDRTECTVSPGRKGRTTSGGGHPCRDCKHLRDGYWSLNGTLQPRRVPVPEPEFADFIETYFATHDRVCTPATVNHRLENIGKRAGSDKTISGANLRMTFGKILAEKGFKGNIIRQVMGFPDTHQGRSLTQRYFILSEQHENPTYHCGEEATASDLCRRTVFFPDSVCYYHE
ncbi:site-specific integrase [Halorussus limi]|uniref:Site-specific integrase n=2 Tax=Halorussus TaxID=1070314 RepID=A0A8U0IM59_9EURY|nr:MULTISPECIES: site-specific integrase [Halorussus]UPV75629.1 site-specific integrase [Halorussus limi]UPW01701.1 site-specific integrase [Halorussus gelatinilyticus]